MGAVASDGGKRNNGDLLRKVFCRVRFTHHELMATAGGDARPTALSMSSPEPVGRESAAHPAFPSFPSSCLGHMAQ